MREDFSTSSDECTLPYIQQATFEPEEMKGAWWAACLEQHLHHVANSNPSYAGSRCSGSMLLTHEICM
jgi:organic hydroperoxide reductase OsmC/OhrA